MHTKPFAYFALVLALCASAAYAQQASAPTAAPAPANAVGKVFAPENTRNPFLSKEEVAAIEASRQADLKRQADAQKRREAEAAAAAAEQLRQQRLAEELAKNPARAIINRITVEGIIGADAIINGNFRSVGDSVLGAKIVKVSDSGVTFTYKGQRFVKNMSTKGVGVL